MGLLDDIGSLASSVGRGIADGYNWVMGNVRPEGTDGHQIYQWFHEGKGTASTVSPKQQAWDNVSKKYDDIQARIKRIINDSHGVWQGKAADAARDSFLPLAQYADAAKQAATQTGWKVGNQGNDWHGAKNQLKPVPKEMPSNNPINAIWPMTTDLDREIDSFKANTTENQRVLAGYGVATGGNLSTMPAWTPPSGSGGDTSLVQTPPGGGGGFDRGRDPGRIRPGGGGTGGGYALPGAHDGNGNGGNGNGTGTGTGGGTGEVPPPRGGERPGPGYVPPPVDNTGLSGVGVEDPVRTSGPLGGPTGGGGTGGGGGAAGGGLGGGFAGGVGYGGGAAGGYGSTPGAGGRAGVGGAAGFGPAGAAAAGAAGRPGAPGMGGGPMGAGAGGRKEEDSEHQRPEWLLENEDVWGGDEQVAPPVIGE
ncbi:hypothetical protein JOF53_006223 [Crossiella equi]|uniref:Uncharacterized protein n=1 Tax=Crossiella equi TaxID=130796 RepID=A0ABS5ALP8_9PSEU|nr:hypothetical protein [Crossiella equi]MBP2477351.1 hypothetical protein [Crossiella equi]